MPDTVVVANFIACVVVVELKRTHTFEEVNVPLTVTFFNVALVVAVIVPTFAVYCVVVENVIACVQSKKVCAILPALLVMTAHRPAVPGVDVAYFACNTSGVLAPRSVDEAICSCVASRDIPVVVSVDVAAPASNPLSTYCLSTICVPIENVGCEV